MREFSKLSLELHRQGHAVFLSSWNASTGLNSLCGTSREGDLVTVTDKNDIQKALEELVTTADKLLGSSHSGRNTLQQMLPPLRLQLVAVESPEVLHCLLSRCLQTKSALTICILHTACDKQSAI